MKETTDDSDHLRVDREEQYTNWNEQTHSSRRNDVTTGRPDRDGPPQGQTSSPRRGQRRAPKLRGRYPMTSEGTCVNPTSGVLTTRLAKKKGEKLRVGECLLRQRPASCRGFKGARLQAGTVQRVHRTSGRSLTPKVQPGPGAGEHYGQHKDWEQWLCPKRRIAREMSLPTTRAWGRDSSPPCSVTQDVKDALCGCGDGVGKAGARHTEDPSPRARPHRRVFAFSVFRGEALWVYRMLSQKLHF